MQHKPLEIMAVVLLSYLKESLQNHNELYWPSVCTYKEFDCGLNYCTQCACTGKRTYSQTLQSLQLTGQNQENKEAGRTPATGEQNRFQAAKEG